MKKINKIFTTLLALMLIFAVVISCGKTDDPATDPTDSSGEKEPSGETPDVVSEFPRSESLYFNGLVWGTSTNFNPVAPSGAGVFAIENNTPTIRVPTYESLFMFNQLDGELHPLLATEYEWEGTDLIVKLNPDAKWNDGEAFTADDVVFTYNFGLKHNFNYSAAIALYVDSAEKIDDHTVRIKAKSDSFNPAQVLNSMASIYMLPEHIWTVFEEESGGDEAKIMQLPNLDPVATGPYKVLINDDTKIVLIRDDNYWGQAPSMWGKLAAPKYMIHNIFKDNAGGDAALKAGEVDVSQQFTAQIQNMFADGVETYLPDPPYYYPGTIPSLIFNTTHPGLDDKNVRKAIAMAIDTDLVAQNAMSGYSAPIVPSIMLPLETEQALIDTEKLAKLQWESADVDKANALLDGAGWVKGADGIRAKDGVKLEFTAECPTGWSDWMASIQVAAQSADKIGIKITPEFPEMQVWMNNMQTGGFEIIMNGFAGPTIAGAWPRLRNQMTSVDLPDIGEMAYYNYGRYRNDRVNELAYSLPTMTDEAEIKAAWTEINEIFLDEVPTAPLMYRPLYFHQVNTTYWEGFPKANDDSNVPPNILLNGYGIAGLYNITPKA